MTTPTHVLLVLSCLVLAGAACAVAPTAAELSRAREWAAAHLREAPILPPAAPADALPEPGLEVVANHGDILLDGRPDGRPIALGGTAFEHGLLCHAPSEVLVRLPGPGATLLTTVGVDDNAGGGSIVFGVRVGGEEAFRSEVLHCGAPGTPVEVALGGAREFALTAGDAGDGIACDHAGWGEVRVVLEDGATVRLSTLPVRAALPPARRGEAPPFAFTYGGRHSDELLPTWDFASEEEPLSEGRTRRTLRWRDPETALEVRCESVAYGDFPVVEWTVWLANGGTSDSRMVDGLQAIDTRFARGGEGEFLLHHNVGSPCRADDYGPLETPLPPQAALTLSAAGGRPTNTDLCYFNLAWPGSGAIVALGWPGQWSARFLRDEGQGLRLIAGQERTRFRLHPGEEARTPLVALLTWEGEDWIRAQNLWRRWMVAHSMPRAVPTHYGVCFGNLQPNAQDEIRGLRQAAEANLPFGYYFLDAGWYPDRGGWWNTGTWEPDPERFPRGVREAMDEAHAVGMQTVLWFEPERCNGDSWLTETHPEWVIGGHDGGLVNLGDPDAWAWVVEHFSGLIESQGIDLYREDYNIDPLGYWQAADSPDRIGLTENHYVVGHLAYWDELLRRKPGLIIDSCASGGRRNDLETMRRAVPLLRSDYFGEPTGQQAQTMGISLWIPYYGSGQGTDDPYFIRSGYFPAARTGWDPNSPPEDFTEFRRLMDECAEVQRHMMADFLPLTPWSLDEGVWAAWQWNVPETGEGAVQAFRRAECPEETTALRLVGLEPDVRYEVRNTDEATPSVATGRALMEEGLTIPLPKRGAAVLLYRRL